MTGHPPAVHFPGTWVVTRASLPVITEACATPNGLHHRNGALLRGFLASVQVYPQQDVSMNLLANACG